MPIEPTRDQINALINSPLDGPVVMLNLLQFRDRTEDGTMSGLDSYLHYGAAVLPLLERVGGKILWQGRGDSVVIGGDADEWDAVVLVQYPSRQRFIEMVTSPDYAEIAHLRSNALVDSRLVACSAD